MGLLDVFKRNKKNQINVLTDTTKKVEQPQTNEEAMAELLRRQQEENESLEALEKSVFQTIAASTAQINRDIESRNANAAPIAEDYSQEEQKGRHR